MTIKLELDPGMEAHLIADAQEQGIAPESYARQLLYSALSQKMQAARRFNHEADEQGIRSFLDAFASKEATPPHLSQDTFSREMIYGEHD